MNLNEGILWLALKGGDAKALFTIYEMLHPDLVRSGRTITSDEEQVKDTINQFFLYLWDKRNSLGDPDNLKSYLIVSFRRRLIHEIKLDHRTISLAEHEYELQPEPTAEEIMINDTTALQTRLRMAYAIDKLPDRQKELLMLKYFENLSCEEIAKKTSLSIRTVYNKIHEAIKSLRRHLT